MTVVLALVAAVLFGTGVALQQEEARHEAADRALRPGLLVRLVSHPRWVAGFVADISGWAVQAWALAVGSLVVVQPIIATNLVFALAIASVLSDQPLGRSEWIAVVVTLVGLIIFFLVGDPTSSSDVNPTRSDWLILVTVVGGGIVGVMVLGLARSGTVRAALFGLGAGGAEALMAVLSKAFADKLSKGVGATFTSWEPYALIIGGIATMIAVQSAYQVGIPTVTLPINSVAEPIIAVIIGLTIFGEHLELGGVRGPFVVFGLTLMAAGVYSLGHSAARAEEAAIEQGQGVVTK